MSVNLPKEGVKQTTVQTLTFITGAFGFVAALAWNEAVKALIDRFFNQGNNIISLFVYAVIVTLIAVIATKRLGDFGKRIEGNVNNP